MHPHDPTWSPGYKLGLTDIFGAIAILGGPLGWPKAFKGLQWASATSMQLYYQVTY